MSLNLADVHALLVMAREYGVRRLKLGDFEAEMQPPVHTSVLPAPTPSEPHPVMREMTDEELLLWSAAPVNEVPRGE